MASRRNPFATIGSILSVARSQSRAPGGDRLASTAGGRRARPIRSSRGEPGPSAPAELLQFDGASYNDNLPFFKDVFPPPDANGAAGPDHYFQAINLVFESSTSPATSCSVLSRTTVSGRAWAESARRQRRHAPGQVRRDGRPVVRQPGRLRLVRRHDAPVHRGVDDERSDRNLQPVRLRHRPELHRHERADRHLARGVLHDGEPVQGIRRRGLRLLRLRRSAMLAGRAGDYQYADAGSASRHLWALPSDLDGLTRRRRARPTSRWPWAPTSWTGAPTTSSTSGGSTPTSTIPATDLHRPRRRRDRRLHRAGLRQRAPRATAASRRAGRAS